MWFVELKKIHCNKKSVPKVFLEIFSTLKSKFAQLQQPELGKQRSETRSPSSPTFQQPKNSYGNGITKKWDS